MEDILMKRWGSKIVCGDEEAPKPPMVCFKNTIEALEILHKHISRNSSILVHCDVDWDGLGCGYIVKKFLKAMGVRQPIFTINSDKEHGIQKKHKDFVNKNNIEFVIIVDSSSNEIETIKEMNCDVLVVDHHKIKNDGVIEDGEHKKIIINNMLDNFNSEEVNLWIEKTKEKAFDKLEDYKNDKRMSGGLVLYELLRLYCLAYNKDGLMEDLMLYQWAGVTLFSDSIQLVSDRNQWYVENTIHSRDLEGSLMTMINTLNEYKMSLSKSLINYTLVPIINKAIRAGKGFEALKVVLFNQSNILELTKYAEIQKEVIEKCIDKDVIYTNDYITKDITEYNISKNYCGVIASNLSGSNFKNVAVYMMKDGRAEGSFRGRYANVDYREFFDKYDESIFAEGHGAAFGFKATIEQLGKIMAKLTKVEAEQNKSMFLTAGPNVKHLNSFYHIEDIDEFKRQFNLMRLSLANSKLASHEEMGIVVSTSEARLVEMKGLVFIYEVLGLKCRAFEQLKTKYANIYVEYSGSIDLYIKNFII